MTIICILMIVAKTSVLSTSAGSHTPAMNSSAASRSSRWGQIGLSGWAAVVALLISLPTFAVLYRSVVSPNDAQAIATLTHLMNSVLPGFISNTLVLASGVLTVVLVAGVGSAWLISAYEFPGRTWLARLLIAPMAMPAFVMGYAYTQAFDVSGPVQSGLRYLTGWSVGQYWFPDIRSIWGAALMLGLALYPYVYMLARPAFADRSAHLGEAARSMGVSSQAIFFRVYLPVARPAIVAGCALVLMETLADFGTVNYFAVDTLAAGIYRAWQGMGDQTAAARLSLILTAFVLIVLAIERRHRGRMVSHTIANKPARRISLRRHHGLLATAFCGLWLTLGFVLPVGLLIHAVCADIDSINLLASGRFVQWTINSAWLALLGVLVIVPSALLVAYACRLSSQSWVARSAQIAASGYALPGVVMAVGILLLAKGLDLLGLGFLRLTVALVLLAYLARFFAIGYQGLSTGLARISPRMDDSARSLGSSPGEVLLRVHWPALRPSVYAASILVFVDCLKELPATLMLRPFNLDTLAVVAYQFASDERLSAAALPSLALIAVGLLPTIWLARDQA
jgi:iron(III) transport system permease protein